MYKVKVYCGSCNKEIDDYVNPLYNTGTLDQLEENLGLSCPYCGNHHGGIYLECDMSTDDFITELSRTPETQIAKHADIIKQLAESLI